MCHERTQSMCTEKVGQHLYTVLVYEGTLSPIQSMTSFTPLSDQRRGLLFDLPIPFAHSYD